MSLLTLTFFTIFSHFTSIAGCECEFHTGTLHVNFKNFTFWQYLSILLKQQIKLVLIIIGWLTTVPLVHVKFLEKRLDLANG